LRHFAGMACATHVGRHDLGQVHTQKGKRRLER
jgi:hypothetical protein